MNTPKSRLALAVIAATASLAQSNIAVAEDKSYQPTLMNQVTVTATRTEKQLKDVAASVTVVDEEQIEKDLVTDIKDLIRYEPGVNVGSDGRTGSEGYNIRGMDGNRVKIMVDGVDQSQQFDSGFTYQRSQRDSVDVDTIKAIEIVKGPSSSLYGGDAIGGIVAYQTKDPSDYLESEGDDTAASVKGTYTSADEGFSETFTLANRTGDLESMLVYTRRDNKETETHGGADITGAGRGQADPLDTGSDNILGKLQYQVNNNNRIGLTVEYLDSSTDVELKSGEGLLPGDTSGRDDVSRKRVSVFHEWDADLTLFDSMKWSVDWQDSETDQYTYIPAYGSRGTRHNQYYYGEETLKLGTQFNKKFVASKLEHSIVYGFDVGRTDTSNKNISDEAGEPLADTSYIPNVEDLSYGIFIQDDIRVNDSLVVTPGLRYDNYKYTPDSGAGMQESKGDKLTGRLGFVYDIIDSVSMFGQFSQGFKAPGLYETYYTHENTPRQYKSVSNPDLKPEESDSFEFGLRGNNHLGSFEITAFYNQYKNFIDTTTDFSDPAFSNGITKYENISEAKIKGVEFRGQIWLDEAANAPEGTSLKASIAYADGENKETGEALNSVAPLTGVFGLAYDDMSGDWGSELVWTLVKSKSDSDVSNDEVSSGTQLNPAGYGLVDLTAYYVPAEDVTLRAGLFNITDKKYYEWNDIRGKATDANGLDRYTQPGRNFSVSVKWDI